MNEPNQRNLHVAALGWTPTAVDAMVQSLDSACDLEIVAASHRMEGFVTALARADVLLVDHRLPHQLAARFLRLVDRLGLQHPLVIVNVPDDAMVIIRYLEGGAMGYLRRDEPISLLTSIVRGVAKGHARLDPDVAGPLLARMDDLRRRIDRPRGFESVTDPHVIDPSQSMFLNSPACGGDRVELEIAASDCMEQAAQVALEHLCSAYGQTMGQVYLRGRCGDALVPAGAWYQEDFASSAECRQLSQDRRITAGCGCVGQVYLTGKPHWSRQIGELPGFRRAETAVRCGLRSMTMTPIIQGKSVVGAIELFNANDAAPSLPLLETLSIAGAQLARRFGQLAESR